MTKDETIEQFQATFRGNIKKADLEVEQFRNALEIQENALESGKV